MFWISFFFSILLEKSIQLRHIKKAQKKLDAIKPKIIAITGSYGKTSCKNYIYELLKDSYNVLKSPKSYNTLNGFLLTINKYLKPHHEILIVEIGVDKKNGMNKFIKHFSFDIGLVTTIGNQHLKTFKAIKNIAKEKTKLLYNCTKGVVINKDCNYLNNLSFYIETISFSLNSKADVYIKNNRLHIFDKVYDISINLIGKHNISNVLASISICLFFNIDIDKVTRKVSMLKNVTHRLSINKVNNITIIDDSYNSNFEGFINALDVLKSFDGIKVIISPGIVEGSNIDEIKLANKIKDCCDEILLINNPSISKYIENKQSFLSFKQAYDYIRKKYQEDKITLLIENDIPDIYLR